MKTLCWLTRTLLRRFRRNLSFSEIVRVKRIVFFLCCRCEFFLRLLANSLFLSLSGTVSHFSIVMSRKFLRSFSFCFVFYFCGSVFCCLENQNEWNLSFVLFWLFESIEWFCSTFFRCTVSLHEPSLVLLLLAIHQKLKLNSIQKLW